MQTIKSLSNPGRWESRLYAMSWLLLLGLLLIGVLR